MDNKKLSVERQQLNLSALVREYRSKGPSARGYKGIYSGILNWQRHNLNHLLRHHHFHAVTDAKELTFRYNTDALLNFYSLVQVGILAGYLPADLPADMRKEIITILDYQEVKAYYESRYPLLLPGLLLNAVKLDILQESADESTVFINLLLLEYSQDAEVEAFLFLLDGYSYDGKDIDDFNNLLGNKTEMETVLGKPRTAETRFEKALWGFIKYSDYMTRYEALLKDCKSPILRSAIWHFKGYWFKNMKELMYDKYITGIKNIHELADKTTIDQYQKNFQSPGFKRINSEEQLKIQQSFERWKAESGRQVETVLQSINYNLQEEHSAALEQYQNSIKTSARNRVNSNSFTDRRGYNSKFLQQDIKFPVANVHIVKNLFSLHKSRLVHYEHFSVMFNTARKLPLCVGYNQLRSKARDSSSGQVDVRRDQRFPELQIGEEFYRDWGLRKMKLVKIDDVAWGSEKSIQNAEIDTSLASTIVPLTDAIPGDLIESWQRLQLPLVPGSAQKLIVFSGPVFHLSDPFVESIQLPVHFFKIFVFDLNHTVAGVGFEMKFLPNKGEFGIIVSPILDIASQTGLTFPYLLDVNRSLNDFDKSRSGPVIEKGKMDRTIQLLKAFLADRQLKNKE